MPITVQTILSAANEAYENGELRLDDLSLQVGDRDDLLADFIVNELAEVTQGMDGPDCEMAIAQASTEAIAKAIDQLRSVLNAIESVEESSPRPNYSDVAIMFKHVLELDALRELAVHEKTHPVTSEFGRYEVAVIRTSSRMATISVDEAEGPATAQLKALEVAGDYDFGSEREAEYISDGYTEFEQKLKVGAQYHWADPDSESESDCSGPVTVCKVEGDVAYVRRSDDTEFEVHPSELH